MLICIKIYHKYFWWQLVPHFSFVHVTLRFLTEKDKQIRWIIILDFIIFLLQKKKSHFSAVFFIYFLLVLSHKLKYFLTVPNVLKPKTDINL